MILLTGADPAGLNLKSARLQLKKRAALLAKIREYFATAQVLEVTTPLLCRYASSDPQINSFCVENPESLSVGCAQEMVSSQPLYLQTSPESGMKQLLSMNSGSIFQLGKAFRRDEPGRLHAVEFSILEWYQIDFSLAQIIDDTLRLVGSVIPDRPTERLSYREAFLRYVGIDPFNITGAALRKVAHQKISVDFVDASDDVWLDLLLTHLIEPHLGCEKFTILHSYPPSQAAMAELLLDPDGIKVAARFELYIDGVELANGYQELTNPAIQQQRFEHDNLVRRERGLPCMDIDVDLLEALSKPEMPSCAGVALGIDRLMLFT